MASIDITTQSGAVGNGDLQLQNGAPMDGTLRFVTDAVNTASPLKLSTSLVQTTSTLKITTNDNTYIDAEDGAGNNRFTVGRDTGSQQVNVDFASNPSGSTTIVGAIRTYADGVNLSEVMAFREDGNIGINTLTPGAKLDIHSASNVILQLNRTGAGKSWLQYLQAGTARWNTGYDNTNGNFTIYDAVAAADRMVVTNAGYVGIGTSTPSRKLIVYDTDANVPTIGLRTDGSGTTTNDGFDLQFANNNTFIANRENGFMSFLTNNSEKMLITAAGNVGIGTSTPTTKLMVEGTGSFGTVSNEVRLQNAGTFVSSTLNAHLINSDGTGAYNSGNLLIQPRCSSGAGVTDIIFATSNNTNTPTERFRITANGVTFNGDTAAANALDDYEEGDWTMGIAFGNASVGVTYNFRGATYTKIGRQVTLNGYMVLSSKGSSTGAATITGLPFTVGGATGNYTSASLRLSAVSFVGQFQANSDISSTTISFNQISSIGTISNMDDTNFANNSAIMVNMTYFV